MVKKDVRIHNSLFSLLFYSETFMESKDGNFISQAFGDVLAIFTGVNINIKEKQSFI
jgi:hypothetical protein